MSNKADAKQEKTVCNLNVMLGTYQELSNIQTVLFGAYEQAETLAADFSESYEGEATEEVVRFLESLPMHIYRLALLYGKMAQFVFMTANSFMLNDQTMADKLEG